MFWMKCVKSIKSFSLISIKKQSGSTSGVRVNTRTDKTFQLCHHMSKQCRLVVIHTAGQTHYTAHLAKLTPSPSLKRILNVKQNAALYLNIPSIKKKTLCLSFKTKQDRTYTENMIFENTSNLVFKQFSLF